MKRARNVYTTALNIFTIEIVSEKFLYQICMIPKALKYFKTYNILMKLVLTSNKLNNILLINSFRRN